MARPRLYSDEERLARNAASARRAYRRKRGVAEDADMKLTTHCWWKSEEEAFVCENWARLSIAQIAKQLGRSVRGVTVHAKVMGLPNKPKIYVTAIERRAAERERIEAWKREREERRRQREEAREAAMTAKANAPKREKQKRPPRERKPSMTAQQRAEARAKKAREAKAMRVVASPPPPPEPKRLSDAEYAFFKARKEMKTRPGRLTVGWR